MPHGPLLLVSCIRCDRLHQPLRHDAANPLCGRCALPSRGARRAAPRPRRRAGARR